MNMKNQKSKIKNQKSGFTLVELLIVIALIGILAAALIATLNPIEQINKARDSRFKNDAAELLAAVERYYASNQDYSWGDGTEDYDDVGEAVLSGVCGDATCATSGELITTGELKSSFRKKEQFASGSDDIDRLHVIYNSTEQSTYVCYEPKANTNKVATGSAEAKDAGGGYNNPPIACPPPFTEGRCMICVPELF